MRLAPFAAVAVFGILLAVSAGRLPGHFAIALVIAGAGALLVYLYFYQVDESRRKWAPQDGQPELTIYHSEMRHREIDRIRRYFLEDETEIHWITHRHTIFLVAKIWLPCLVAVASLALAAAVGNVHISAPHHSGTASKAAKQPSSTLPAVKPALPGGHGSGVPAAKIHIPSKVTIPWWVIALPAVGCLLVILFQWAAWSCWYFIVTNRRVIVLERPYSAFPFMNGDDKPFTWALIKNAEIDGSDFQRRWGLASISISTYLQPPEDDAIKGLVGLPHPDEIAGLVNGLVPEHGSLDEGSSEMRELNANIRELTETLRLAHGLPSSATPRTEWPTQET
jgi:hypothetical protein